MKQFLIIYLFISLVNCGKKSNSGGNRESNRPYSMTVNTADQLPTCDSAHVNQIVYVSDENQLYACGEDSEWAAISPGALNIDKWISYETTTYAGADNLVTDGGAATVYIANINLYLFSNDTANITVTGNYRASDSDSDTYYFDFNHSFYVYKKNGKYLYPTYFKLKESVDLVISYKVDLSAPESFKAAVDTDGNMLNDTYQSFTLN
jgi:hypothetical protein